MLKRLLSQKQNITPNTHRWAISVFFFISGFSFASWASRIPDLKQRLQLNDAELGSLLFAIPVGLMVTMPFAAYLLMRFSSRNVMLAAALLYAIVLCTLGFVTNAWQAATILFLFGAARNLLNISINTQSVSVQALFQKSVITSFHGVWSIAAFCGAAFASLLISSSISPALHFILVGFIVMVLVSIAFKNTMPRDAVTDTKKHAFVLPNKQLFTLGLIAFCSMVCEGTMSDWSGIYFIKEIKVQKSFSTVGYVAYLSAVALGRFLGDVLVNKLGSKRLLQFSGCCITLGISMAIFFPYIITASIGFLITGFGVSCIMPLVYSNTAKITTMPTGPAIASVATVGYMGFLCGPPLVGFIAHTYSIQISFALAACFGIIIVLLVSKTRFQ